MKGFVLIGGAALTKHLGHRLSAGLDFACVEPTKHLPKPQIRELVNELAQAGLSFILSQDPAAIEEFDESGLDLDDYRQHFIADDVVKVSLVCYDPPMDLLLPGRRTDAVRVAKLDELLATTAYACSARSSSRDWLDLYVLLTRQRYTFKDIYSVYQTINRMAAFASMTARLRRCRPDAADEGYVGLLTDPPSIDDLRNFFNHEIDGLEKQLAKEAFSKHRLEGTGFL